MEKKRKRMNYLCISNENKTKESGCVMEINKTDPATSEEEEKNNTSIKTSQTK